MATLHVVLMIVMMTVLYVVLICHVIHATNRAFSRFFAATALAVHGANVSRSIFRAFPMRRLHGGAGLLGWWTALFIMSVGVASTGSQAKGQDHDKAQQKGGGTKK